MNIKLPAQRFYTYTELAERWSCTVDYIAHLVDINELPVADKYAAMNGKQRTIFVAAMPIFRDERERQFYEAIKAVANDYFPDEPASDRTLIVEVPIPDAAIHDQEKWDACLDTARDAFPESQISVVLTEHVLQFEARHQSAPYQQPQASPWVPRATELGKQFKKGNPRLSQDQIAEKVAKKLDVEGIKGRGQKPISAATIKREALKGVK